MTLLVHFSHRKVLTGYPNTGSKLESGDQVDINAIVRISEAGIHILLEMWFIWEGR